MKLVAKEKIREIVAALDAKEEAVDEHKADVKELLAGVDKLGMRKDAFRSAMKLRKLNPAKLSAWLITFDRVVETLGLRSQLDIETAIAAADEAFDNALKGDGGGGAGRAAR